MAEPPSARSRDDEGAIDETADERSNTGFRAQRRRDRFNLRGYEIGRREAEYRSVQQRLVAEKNEEIRRLRAQVQYLEAAPYEMRRHRGLAVEAARHGNGLVHMMSNINVPMIRKDFDAALHQQPH